MRFLREWVLSNWGLKLLALAISFLLWATYTSAPPAEMGYLVPLEFNNISRELEISGDVPTQVHVRLRGRSALLRRLTPLTPEQIATPYGATVVRLTPSQVRVLLVPRPASR